MVWVDDVDGFLLFHSGGHFQVQHARLRCLENKSYTCSPNGGEINDDLPMVGSGKIHIKRNRRRPLNMIQSTLELLFLEINPSYIKVFSVEDH